MGLFRRKPKQRKATLRDARAAFQAQVDYWETRMFYGDPLFDQWMVDALEESRNGLAVLDRMEALDADTGKADILPNVPISYTKVKIKIERAYDGNWSAEYNLDDHVVVSYGRPYEAPTKQAAYELAVTKLSEMHPTKVTEATTFKLS